MASDIKVAVGRWAASTTTGLQELTIAGLGWTPKAAIFVTIGATVNGTVQAMHAISYGAIGGDGAGGLNEWCLWGGDRDNVTTTDAQRAVREDACVYPCYQGGGGLVEAYATGDGDGSAGNPGPIANGWRVNWLAAPDQAYFIQAMFFGGADFNSHVGNFLTPTTLDGVTDVTAPGFTPTCVTFTTLPDLVAAPITRNHMRYSFGWAVNDTGNPQACTAFYSRPFVATTETYVTVFSNRAVAESDNTGIDYTLEIGGFDASGFSATRRIAGGDADYVYYAAFDLGDRKAWAGVLDTPTSGASDWVVSAPGFKPQAGMLFTTNADTVDAQETTGPDSECSGISLFDAANAYCATGVSQDGVGTSNTASVGEDVLLRTLDGSQADVNRFTGVPSFTASGWSVPSAQLATVNGTARKLVAWALEEAAAATVTRTASLDGAMQKQNMLAGSLGAALQARRSAAAQGDAALRALISLAGELDAALRRALAAQAGLDGALAAERAEGTAIDAALRRALAAEAGLGGALLAGRSRSAAIDALLTALHGGTVGLDAALAALGSGALTLDAALALLGERDAGLDAALRRLRSAVGSLDAALTASRVVNASLQAALGKALALTAALDAVVRQTDLVLKSDLDGALQTTKALSLSLQSVLQKAMQLSSGLSGALQVSAEPLTGSLQAALTRTATLVATLSGAVRLMRSLAVGLSAALQERAALSSLLDAVVGTPPAAYAPRGTRGFTVEGRDRAIIGPDNRIILIPANPRRH